jgi:Cu+-exporting ATPase
MITPSSKLETFTDPVCKMTVGPGRKGIISKYNGQEYYFCAEACRDSFDKDPQKYLEAKPMKRKGLWGRYLDRLNKVTSGKTPPCCH